MKYVLRILGVLVLGAVLAGCSSEPKSVTLLEAQTAFITSKTWVSSNTKFASPTTNCVSTEFYSLEQGARAKPFSGGLNYKQFADIITPNTIGTELRTSFFSTASSPKVDTEILIIDDFGTGQYTLPPFYNYDNVESLLASGTYRHGALVMYHANEVIKGSGLYGTANQSATGQTVYTSSNKTTLKVTPVNTQLASQEAIFNGVKVNIITTGRLVDVLQEKGKEYLLGSKVFNMSFGIVSCEIYADFEFSKLETFREYIEAFVAKNDGAGFTNNNKQIDLPKEKEALNGIIESTNLPNDPLKQLIASETNRHIFVAAAGNYGVDVSMYPANWPGVVNVTGSSVTNRNRRLSTEFNKGEVMTVGSLFKITAPTGSNHLYYYGTSFATPSVSVYSALDLAGQQRCTDTNSQNLKSELALDGGSFTLTNRRLENSYNALYDIFTPGAIQIRCGTN